MKLRTILISVALAMTAAACPSGGQRGGHDTSGMIDEVDIICQTDKSGGDMWDVRIKKTFLAYADANGSGEIDAMSELQQIPCPVWRRMDQGVRQDQPAGFMQVYGFDPRLIWVGAAVGISERLRNQATEYLSACGLTTDMHDAPRPAGRDVPGSAAGGLLGEVEAICSSEKSGTDSWDGRIARALVGHADRNGSRDIDSVAELELVECEVWRRMDRGIVEDQGSAFMTIYGFDPRLIWVGSAVGINEALRPQATQYLANCGMSAGMD